MKETTSEDAVIVRHDRRRGSVFTGCHVARTRRRLDQPPSAGHLRRRRRPPPPYPGQMPQMPSCSKKDLRGPSPEPKMWRRQSRMRPIQAHRAQIGPACLPPAHTTGRRRHADSQPPPARLPATGAQHSKPAPHCTGFDNNGVGLLLSSRSNTPTQEPCFRHFCFAGHGANSKVTASSTRRRRSSRRKMIFGLVSKGASLKRQSPHDF
jgi:hypothetical protein